MCCAAVRNLLRRDTGVSGQHMPAIRAVAQLRHAGADMTPTEDADGAAHHVVAINSRRSYEPPACMA